MKRMTADRGKNDPRLLPFCINLFLRSDQQLANQNFLLHQKWGKTLLLGLRHWAEDSGSYLATNFLCDIGQVWWSDSFHPAMAEAMSNSNLCLCKLLLKREIIHMHSTWVVCLSADMTLFICQEEKNLLAHLEQIFSKCVISCRLYESRS